MAAPKEEEDVLFPTLQQNADGSAGTEIESLCMNCHKQGITRLLMTQIPFFKEVVIMAFECEHCGYRSSDVQPGGQIAEFGVTITCSVETAEDLQRSVLISDAAVVKVPEVELEIPSSQRGRLTTIEGLIDEVMENLTITNDDRRKADPKAAETIASYVARLAMLKSGTEKFHVEIRDTSGNSAVEGSQPGKKDPLVDVKKFERTDDENQALGLQPAERENMDTEEAPMAVDETKATKESSGTEMEEVEKDGGNAEEEGDQPGQDEILILQEHCPACGKGGESRMKLQDIPFFKQVILMAFACDYCGYKNTEVKPSGQIGERGRKTTLRVTTVEDLSRDILKSDTCILDIPEIELTLEAGTLGSVFTTIEGILLKAKDNLKAVNPFSLGDSAGRSQKAKFAEFFARLDKLAAGEEPFTLILDDPAGNSFVQNLYAPDPDPEMKIDEYERDEEQDEELGLTQSMKEETTT